MNKIVVLGNAKTGMAFVGPFLTEGEANDYITKWRAGNEVRGKISAGVIELHATADFAAGNNLRAA
jgi:hypothetical protein